jgi:hypothetical protein
LLKGGGLNQTKMSICMRMETQMIAVVVKRLNVNRHLEVSKGEIDGPGFTSNFNNDDELTARSSDPYLSF